MNPTQQGTAAPFGQAAGRPLEEFLFQELYPAISSRPDLTFPEMPLVACGDSWQLSQEEADRLFPRTSAGFRTYAHCTSFGLRCSTGAFLTWIGCVAGGAVELPPEKFLLALRELARRAKCPFPQQSFSPMEIEDTQRRHRSVHLMEAFLSHGHAVLMGPAGRTALEALCDAYDCRPEEIAASELALFPETAAVIERLKAHGFQPHDIFIDDLFLGNELRTELSGNRVVGSWRDRLGAVEFLWTLELGQTRPATLQFLKNPDRAELPICGWGNQTLSRMGKTPLLLTGDPIEAFLLRQRGAGVAAGLGRTVGGFPHLQWRRFAPLGIRDIILCLEPGEDGPNEINTYLRGLGRSTNPPRVTVLRPDQLDSERSPSAYVQRAGVEEFQQQAARAPGATYLRATALLGAVGLQHSLNERMEAVRRVQQFLQSEHPQGLIGPESEQITQLVVERTGLNPNDLIAENPAAGRSGGRAPAGGSLDRLLQDAVIARAAGKDAVEVARALLQSLEQFAPQGMRSAGPCGPSSLFSEESRTSGPYLGRAEQSGRKALEALGYGLPPAEPKLPTPDRSAKWPQGEPPAELP